MPDTPVTADEVTKVLVGVDDRVEIRRRTLL